MMLKKAFPLYRLLKLLEICCTMLALQPIWNLYLYRHKKGGIYFYFLSFSWNVTISSLLKTKPKLINVRKPAWYCRGSKWPPWSIICLVLFAKPSHFPKAMRDILHIKISSLTFSTNKPKNAAQVCCAALAGRGALASLIIYRHTCQVLLCICPEMESRSPGIESHYYSAPTICYHENEDASWVHGSNWQLSERRGLGAWMKEGGEI